jgi:NitT/TauT family transport system ATP-binding protein
MTATPDFSAAAISVRGLWHAFYDRRRRTIVQALTELSFDVAPGEFICLVGPSGCGKTTALRLLAGLEPVIAGSIDVGSRPAMVFQETSLFPWLTVERNVTYPLRIRGVNLRDHAVRVDALLEVTSLIGFRDAYPHQLSGGMKQRASVARALVDDRAILLMDEPFAALDEQTRLKLQQELLRVWGESGKTVVFITHSVEEALTLADRVLVMSARPGRVIKEVCIPFTRPRNVIELRHETMFRDLAYEIWSSLKPMIGLDAP